MFKTLTSIKIIKIIMGFFSKKYNLHDLENISSQISIKRKNFEIAIIEDKTFPPLEKLIKNGYRIELFKDIDRISTLSEFDIIITDIRGVGKILGGDLEGAHLIKEIKREYPYKYLIAYSASFFNPNYNKYFKLCDIAQQKGLDISEWSAILDNAMAELSNPIIIWQKTVDLLRKQNISLDEIGKLEQSYIKSIINKNEVVFHKRIDSYKGNEHIKPITEAITTFTATLIAELIKP